MNKTISIIAVAMAIFALVARPTHASGTHENCYKYLELDTHHLYNSLTGGRMVGKCRIQVSPKGGACYLYAKAAAQGADGDFGYPKANVNHKLLGTGCVKAPDLPKHVNTCYYSDTRYGLSQSTIASFCTSKGKDNAVAMIRHAIRNKKCGLCY